MRESDSLPKPLPPAEFYALLALNKRTLHGYGLKDEIWRLSKGSVVMPDSNLYRLISKLERDVHIEINEPKPSGPSGKTRLHYSITEYGTIRLKEECQRLQFAVKIATSRGLLDEETVPFDLQRLMLHVEQDQA